MFLIKSKENSSKFKYDQKSRWKNLKILFMTYLKLSSTWYCKELLQRSIQERLPCFDDFLLAFVVLMPVCGSLFLVTQLDAVNMHILMPVF